MPYKDKAKAKEYAKKYRAANKDKQAAYTKRWRAENQELIKEAKREYQSSQTDDFYTLYYLPEHHYVGITTKPRIRMQKHRNEKNRITKGYETIATFNSKREALDAERYMHKNLGYLGINKNYNDRV
tara:strand:+ start:153 stop:533 length:381 start_codon:yes stop_codon:yes gene_type:complete